MGEKTSDHYLKDVVFAIAAGYIGGNDQPKVSRNIYLFEELFVVLF